MQEKLIILFLRLIKRQTWSHQDRELAIKRTLTPTKIKYWENLGVKSVAQIKRGPSKRLRKFKAFILNFEW